MGKAEEPKLISDTSFVVVDVETTGMSASHNRVTEIGIVKVENGEITNEFTTLFNPKQFIPEAITRLTGITNEMVYGKPEFSESFPQFRQFFDSSDIFVGHNASFDYKFVNESIVRSGFAELKLPMLCTCRMARRLNSKLPSKSLGSLSKFLGIRIRRAHRALDDARATAMIMLQYIDRLVEEFQLETIDELLGFQYRKIYEMHKIPKSLKRIKVDLQSVPQCPGVYFMKSRTDKILYIGKAKNLKDRVSSYFYHNVSHTRKVKNLIAHVRSFEYEQTNSELSALMRESELIKMHKPKYNSAMRRYRRFPFIKIDAQNDFPRVVKTYEIKHDGAKYYGPFRSSYTVNTLIHKVNETYRLRKCDDAKIHPDKNFSPCLYYEIDQCGAPCNLTQSRKEYRMEVTRVDGFLTSENEGAVKHLEDEMNRFAEEMNYEEAAFARDHLNDLRKVILNMELTASEINLKNFIIKCRDDNREEVYEIFFVVNGKLAHKFVLDLNGDDEDGKMNFTEEIENLYFGGTLFGAVNVPVKQNYTIQEIDKINIITNWICLNNSSSVLMKIDAKTKLKDIMKFLLGRKNKQYSNQEVLEETA